MVLSVHDPVAAAEEAVRTAEPAFGKYFLIRFLGLDLVYDDAEQTCTVRLPYAGHLGNAAGGVHGGVLSTVLDISMGHTCQRYLSPGATVEMQLRFFRPVRGDSTCTGRVLRPGRRLVHLESRLHDEQGRLAASATGTWFRHDAD